MSELLSASAFIGIFILARGLCCFFYMCLLEDIWILLYKASWIKSIVVPRSEEEIETVGVEIKLVLEYDLALSLQAG